MAQGALGAWLLGGLRGLGAAVLGAGTRGAPGTLHPCQAPQEWEAHSVLYPQNRSYRHTLLSCDGLDQHVRVPNERKVLIPGKRLFEYTLFYKGGLIFQIEQAIKQCSKITLTAPGTL